MSAASAVEASSNERKYTARNPAVRLLIERFLARITREVLAARPARIVDLGCGEGQVAERIAGALGGACDYLGLDASAAAIEIARTRCPGLELQVGDVLSPARSPGWADVTLCLEVLEHLPQPELLAARLREWSGRLALVSVPWEPYFRLGNLARGKYVSRFGNHPEHCQSFNPRSLAALLAPHFAEVHVETCFPWLIAIARTRG